MEHQDFFNKFSAGREKNSSLFFSPQRIIVIYTSFCILLKIRKILGLECMVEYLHNYIRVIEKNNPQLKHAVERSLSLINVEKIYQEARRIQDE